MGMINRTLRMSSLGIIGSSDKAKGRKANARLANVQAKLLEQELADAKAQRRAARRTVR